MSYRPPSYCRQRSKGRVDRAYVVIASKRHWLGTYGTDESRAKYLELIGKPQESEPEPILPSTDPTISELILAYLKHAQIYYQKPDGTTGGEYGQYVTVLAVVRNHYGPIPAKDFGPKKLKIIRKELVDKELARKNINKQTGRVVRAFKWAVAEELIPPATYQALAALDGLQRGRSKAKETKPIRPVAMNVVDATLLELPEVVRDMVAVQLHSGMRPGELVIMRPKDINREKDVWIYSPEFHKTEHLGHSKTIAIGPRAQAVLLRYLARADDACMFQPRDSEAKRLRAQEAQRVTPKGYGNRRGTNRKTNPKKQPGCQYTVDSYRQAIQRAAKRAQVERWSPHRLRHNRATDIRKEFGLDATQAVMGHRGAKVTEVYAELDQAKAVDVARKTG
jgi:integrase